MERVYVRMIIYFLNYFFSRYNFYVLKMKLFRYFSERNNYIMRYFQGDFLVADHFSEG